MAWVRPRLWITPENRKPAGRLGDWFAAWGGARGAKGSERPLAKGATTCWGEGRAVKPAGVPSAARPEEGARGCLG